MRLDNNHKAFFALVKAGLWDIKVQLLPYGQIDIKKITRFAEEQSVTGLVVAGLEQVSDIKLPQEDVLSLIGTTIQIEQRNQSMNQFVSELIGKLRDADVYSLLLKGQGIAQCYERPLWRAAGDVDLFLSDENYKKAVPILSALSTSIEEENAYNKHLAMALGPWEVELHGTLKVGLWGAMDDVLYEVQNEVICRGAVRSWMNGETQTFLLRADEDVVYVFAHILQHFYQEGVGLRQICDWCRLLWKYNGTIDERRLELRLRKMGVMSEWKSFAAFAVDYLGMPVDAMPLYLSSNIWRRRAEHICSFILRVGNFGIKDSKPPRNHSIFVRKLLSFFEIISYTSRHVIFFPISSIRTFFYQVWIGLRANVMC